MRARFVSSEMEREATLGKPAPLPSGMHSLREASPLAVIFEAIAGSKAVDERSQHPLCSRVSLFRSKRSASRYIYRSDADRDDLLRTTFLGSILVGYIVAWPRHMCPDLRRRESASGPFRSRLRWRPSANSYEWLKRSLRMKSKVANFDNCT